MKIQREVNGQPVEFELTPEEMSAAYYEKQHELDVQDVRNLIEGEMDPDEFEEKYGVPGNLVLSNESLLDDIARKSRYNQDHDGQEWQPARDNAIRDVLDQQRDSLLAVHKQHSEPCKVFPGLPERCFSVSETTGELIIIVRGEPGYQKVLSGYNLEENQRLADGHNAEMGVSKAQAAAMKAGSLFGWTAQGANPAIYDANGQLKRETLEDKIASAEQAQKASQTAAVEMDYGALRNLLRSVEGAGKGHVEAYVVFTEDSFDRPYPEKSRTYVFSSDNKAFQPAMGGYSIYGACLDGTDQGIRLEAHMAAEKGGKAGWKIDRCYMSQAELNKANKLIEAARGERADKERC